jgi:hypothetical protein
LVRWVLRRYAFHYNRSSFLDLRLCFLKIINNHRASYVRNLLSDPTLII